jgi:hypothetical protein
MYGAAAAVNAIPTSESAVIEIASPHCSMERSVLKASPLKIVSHNPIFAALLQIYYSLGCTHVVPIIGV